MAGWQSASEAGESGGIPPCSDRDLDLDLLAVEYVEDRVQCERAFPRVRFGSLEFEILLPLHPRQIPSPINVLADRMGAPVRAVENAAEQLQRRNLVTITSGSVGWSNALRPGASAFNLISSMRSASGGSTDGRRPHGREIRSP
jgi:hypothetical protein